MNIVVVALIIVWTLMKIFAAMNNQTVKIVNYYVPRIAVSQGTASSDVKKMNTVAADIKNQILKTHRDDFQDKRDKLIGLLCQLSTEEDTSGFLERNPDVLKSIFQNTG